MHICIMFGLQTLLSKKLLIFHFVRSWSSLIEWNAIWKVDINDKYVRSLRWGDVASSSVAKESLKEMAGFGLSF